MKVHFIAIGGSAMHNLAIALKQKGYTINHKTVLKLMNELNIKGKQRKNGKYHSYKGEIQSDSEKRKKSFFEISVVSCENKTYIYYCYGDYGGLRKAANQIHIRGYGK